MLNSRVDPDLVAPLEAFLAAFGENGFKDLPTLRKHLASFPKPTPLRSAVSVQALTVPGVNAPDTRVRVFRPPGEQQNLPALLWIHGGGFMIGSAENEDLFAERTAELLNCLVVSVDYRLAPENPFPAPLDDCYSALAWLLGEATSLGVDPYRVVIGGESAGGGLAAALALLARDRDVKNIALQLLVHPMLDDRNVEQASDELADTLLWTRENNLIGWRAYLAKEPGSADVSPYAAPARAPDLSGLPPAYLAVGELDLFLGENITYVQRLIAAGVASELHVYRGAYHGFPIVAPNAPLTKRFERERDAVLWDVMHG